MTTRRRGTLTSIEGSLQSPGGWTDWTSSLCMDAAQDFSRRCVAGAVWKPPAPAHSRALGPAAARRGPSSRAWGPGRKPDRAGRRIDAGALTEATTRTPRLLAARYTLLDHGARAAASLNADRPAAQGPFEHRQSVAPITPASSLAATRFEYQDASQQRSPAKGRTDHRHRGRRYNVPRQGSSVAVLA